MNFKGVIIEESLINNVALQSVNIVSTRIEPVTDKHKTPWLKQWTLHTVDIPETKINEVAEIISKSLDRKYWYADFKNELSHYIIFSNKVYKVDRSKPEQYKNVSAYGISLGIPDYQLDFSPAIAEWNR